MNNSLMDSLQRPLFRLAVENPNFINSYKRRLIPNIQQTARSTPHLDSANDRVILSVIRRLLHHRRTERQFHQEQVQH
jgi:hypothetical protein